MQRHVPVQLGEGESLAVIVLGRTRSAVRIQSTSPPAQAIQPLDSAFLIEWPPTAHPREALVTFESSGGPIVVADVEAFSAEVFKDADAGEVPAASDLQTLGEWRLAASEAAGNHAEARAFFNELDASTLAWSEERDNLQTLLLEFYRLRWKGNDDPTTGSILSSALMDTLKDTAKMFTDLFDKHFADIEQVRDAFDLFARGELSLLGSAVPVPNGVQPVDVALACQPDSTLVYLYAELAQACIHHNVATVGTFASPGVWADLRSTLVNSHKLFCEAYGVGGKYDSRLPTNGILAPGKALADIRAERGANVATMAPAVVAWNAQLRADVTNV